MPHAFLWLVRNFDLDPTELLLCMGPKRETEQGLVSSALPADEQSLIPKLLVVPCADSQGMQAAGQQQHQQDGSQQPHAALGNPDLQKNLLSQLQGMSQLVSCVLVNCYSQGSMLIRTLSSLG